MNQEYLSLVGVLVGPEEREYSQTHFAVHAPPRLRRS